MKKKSFLFPNKNLKCYQSHCQYFKRYRCTYKTFVCPLTAKYLAIPEFRVIEDKEAWDKFIKNFKY